MIDLEKRVVEDVAVFNDRQEVLTAVANSDCSCGVVLLAAVARPKSADPYQRFTALFTEACEKFE